MIYEALTFIGIKFCLNQNDHHRLNLINANAFVLEQASDQLTSLRQISHLATINGYDHCVLARASWDHCYCINNHNCQHKTCEEIDTGFAELCAWHELT